MSDYGNPLLFGKFANLAFYLLGIIGSHRRVIVATPIRLQLGARRVPLNG